MILTSVFPSLSQRQLSSRQQRKQSIDHVGDSHLRNVYHMNRRIENMYSATERKKNVFDTSLYPVHIRRAHQNEVCRSVCNWKPQPRTFDQGRRSATIICKPILPAIPLDQ